MKRFVESVFFFKEKKKENEPTGVSRFPTSETSSRRTESRGSLVATRARPVPRSQTLRVNTDDTHSKTRFTANSDGENTHKQLDPLALLSR